jgi:glycosyltransferase involved in cell wall biosynthesis
MIYIIKFLKSIQYQNFEKLELILVDDCSIDDTLEIIKNYTYKDKRIKIIENKKRKGTFFVRNIGVIYSKGKYILIPDPDDIITNNILYKCYKLAEKYQYDIIRFYIYDGNKKVRFNNLNKNIEKSEVNQPKLSTFIFYINNELKINDFNIYNKFIKKDIYIISLNSLNKFYLRMYMTFYEDQIINYILHRTAKSLIFIENIGYYYLGNSMSITKNVFKSNKILMLFTFIYLKFIFDYSKNRKYEKDMANTIFSKLLKNLEKFKILFKINNNDNNYKFFYKIINMYFNSKFILKLINIYCNFH